MAADSSAIDVIVTDTLTHNDDQGLSLKEVQGITKRLLKYWILGALLGLIHLILGIVAVTDPCHFGSHAIGLSEYGTSFWLAGTVSTITTVIITFV